MAFSSAGGGASRAQINVTPLIDVLLTLIVMFMLVVSMDKENGETAQIPQQPKNGETQSQPERTVVIQVVWTAKDQRPTVKVNKEEIPWAQLDDRWRRFICRGWKKWRSCRAMPMWTFSMSPR